MRGVIWLTGESGAGKTAVANVLRERHFPEAVILDGDEMRDSVSLDLREDFTRDGRTEHNLRVARLARELSKQTLVIVAVIAPMERVREERSKVCSPTWIYIERDLPEKENHFYEVPASTFLVNHDMLSVNDSADAIADHIYHPKFSLFIGRYQPLHPGHKTLLRSVLDEGKNVCVALRDTVISKSDPFTAQQRRNMFADAFGAELESGQMRIIVIPDIEEVCYGRKVGWGIRQIELDPEVEKISATEIRANADHEKPSSDGANVT